MQDKSGCLVGNPSIGRNRKEMLHQPLHSQYLAKSTLACVVMDAALKMQEFFRLQSLITSCTMAFFQCKRGYLSRVE